MYEYKVEKCGNVAKLEKTINDYAKKGWRVVSVVFYADIFANFVVTLERNEEESSCSQ